MSKKRRALRAVASHLLASPGGACGEQPQPPPPPPPPPVPTHPLHAAPLFSQTQFAGGLSDEQKASLHRDGHLLLPGLLTPDVTARLIASIKAVSEIGGPWKAKNRPKGALARLRAMQAELEEEPHHAGSAFDERLAAFERAKAALLEEYPHAPDHSPGACPYEWSSFLEGVIGHPDMLRLVRDVLGDDVRFDHQVLLNKPPGAGEQGYHTHEYADGRVAFDNVGAGLAAAASEQQRRNCERGLLSTQELLGHRYMDVGQLADGRRHSVNDPSLGYIRVFFYANGFAKGDGNLKVSPGSHHFRDPTVDFLGDEALETGWLAGKTHPMVASSTAAGGQEPLRIEELECPPGSVIVLHTHAVHGVSARKPDSSTRYAVTTAYRNPGAPSHGRWINDAWALKPVPGLLGPPELGAAGLKDHTWR